MVGSHIHTRPSTYGISTYIGVVEKGLYVVCINICQSHSYGLGYLARSHMAFQPALSFRWRDDQADRAKHHHPHEEGETRGPRRVTAHACFGFGWEFGGHGLGLKEGPCT